MRIKRIVIFALLTLASAYCLFLSPIVEIEQGKLRGIRVSGVNRYYGIQYATSDRFHPPKEPRRWSGVYNAVNPVKAPCAQITRYTLLQNEQCLYLDVYTPENAKPGDKLPVFIFIHGGGFYFGSKLLYNPEFLVTKNIVAVSINYRLGVFGFLCVNGVANLGLKDQVAALRWVKKNIAAFGGDPNHVTLAGQSAGAVSTSMHMVSEKSAGLFHKAILLSGYSLAPWAFNVDPITSALTDANLIDEARTEHDIYRIFAKSSTREVLLATQDVFYNMSFKYSPCLDSNFPDPFFRDAPYEIMKSGYFNRVPVLMGVTNNEGIMFYGSNNRSSFAEWDSNFVTRLPSVFSWCSKDDQYRIAKRLRYHYFGYQTIDERSVKTLVRYYNHWLDHGTFDAFAQLLVQHSGEPVYKYVFSYQGLRNIPKFVFGGAATRLYGASHSDDLGYLFKPAGLPIPTSKEDARFIDRYTTMIANFIKYSDPTPRRTSLLPVRWPPSTSRHSDIMHLDRTLKITRGPYLKDRFYLDILCTYGLKGFVPCESRQQCFQREYYDRYPI
ncbi:esterase FE4-like [Plodia interpunctella]|uniref:esterase FE4-like n=1 Tax=Plodia interpunctella TaxID=58824 RepID=UPI0023679F34|nr:esterase FE4-like [Plodia interpunctella]